VQTWSEFVAYVEKMRGSRIVESMKDFYWDIRPKPEYGTVEIRVLDTPLTVERAAQLVAYAQTLAHYVLTQRPLPVSAAIYLVYRHNRFQACRYGFDATYVDAYTQQQVPLQQAGPIADTGYAGYRMRRRSGPLRRSKRYAPTLPRAAAMRRGCAKCMANWVCSTMSRTLRANDGWDGHWCPCN
jgi:hypothetical protein